MSGPIVVTIPGAKLLSSELSKNARIDRFTKARVTKMHRQGANVVVATTMGALPGYRCTTRGTYKDGLPIWRVNPAPAVRSVTLTRICPVTHFADGDNASTLLSAVRDGLADAIQVNDKVMVPNPTGKRLAPGQIGITYEQIAGDWGVRITIERAAPR
jgi:hypothetical protein